MSELRRCHECGQPLEKKDWFCPRCGAKQPREAGRGGHVGAGRPAYRNPGPRR